jgi:class 3 adenylate cyclase/tetratricopeptide (TPR) repeat protein
VHCFTCGRSNADDATFCSYCGSRLAQDTLSPSHDLTRYVPTELQAKLEAARTGRSMAGERRTVTMLFADIQGSTAAAESLDPEDWAEIVNGAFERLIEPVYRYEGTLARLMGDAVLAFFGAPIAHEDDPERAVRAGLDMLAAARPYAREMESRWGVTFDLRVGINTGLVVVGEVGSDLRVEYTALGDAVNVAARMEQTAHPGTLQISASTHRLVDGQFRFEELEPVVAKGKSSPVAAFRVIGAQERPDTTRGLPWRDTPLVGREPESEVLRSVVDRLRKGEGQICTVVGEAGAGKSRLVTALHADLSAAKLVRDWSPDTTGPQIQWGVARCLSYNTSVAYAPFADLFSGILGLSRGLDPPAARRKVESAVATVSARNPDLMATDLCVLLDLELDPKTKASLADLPAPVLQRRVFTAVVGYLEACVAVTPGVLVFEDLHWADSVSLSLLEELMALADRAPLAIIALTRPYREDASWRYHETASRDFPDRYASIELRSLPPTATLELVGRLLGGGTLPASLEAKILERADGNPLFVEEILRDLIESGTIVAEGDTWVPVGDVDTVALPPGVSGLLTARLDRLDEASRLVAQLASVIGRDFAFEELASIAGDDARTRAALAELEARGLLTRAESAVEGDYTFRHALIQEAAYDTILLKARRELHARVADHLVTHGSEPQEIARHLLNSRQETRAVPFLIEAGERATRAMSLADAIRLYDQASTWLTDDADDDLIRRLQEGLGHTYTLIPDLSGASAAYQRLLDIGRARSAPSLQVLALNRLGFTSAFLGGDLDRAATHLEEARRLAEAIGDEAGLAEYHTNACMISTTRGDMEQAAIHDGETARLGIELGSDRLTVGGMLRQVIALILATRFDDARRSLDRAHEATADVSDPVVLTTLAEAEAFLLGRDGRYAEVWELTRDAAETAASIGSSQASIIAWTAANAAAMLGDPENALTYHAEAIRLGVEAGQHYYAAAAAASMVHVYAELGINDARVSDLRRDVQHHLNGPVGTMLETSVLAELGWTALSWGEPAEGARLFETALAGSSASRLWESPSLLLGLALATASSGDMAGATRHLAEASDFIADRQMAGYMPLESFVRGALLQSEGRFEEAASVYGSGADHAAVMGVDRLVWRLRVGRARALASAGLVEAARTTATEARRDVEALADRIVDPDLRASFRSTAIERLSLAVPST